MADDFDPSGRRRFLRRSAGFMAATWSGQRSQVGPRHPPVQLLTTMPGNWHEQAYFGIHYDLHATAHDTVLGKDLDAHQLRRLWGRIKPDWIQTDCKGHPGYTSWPTRIGSTSPGVVKDALRVYRDVTHELGMRLGVHYSGILDARAVELHPEWAHVSSDGVASRTAVCLTSAYERDLMIPQMLEVLDRYEVDGFWVDGENWAAQPCWSLSCQAEFRRRMGAVTVPRHSADASWSAWLAFHRDLFTEHVRRYTDAVHTHRQHVLVTSNWMYSARQPESPVAPIDYLSGDFAPRWGAASAALEARFYDGRQMSWDLMAWMKVDTAAHEPAATKTAIHLCQELSEVIAHGGSAMVYENPQRSGWLTEWHHQVIAEVAEFCRIRKPVCFGTRSIPQAAILHDAHSYYAANQPLYGPGEALDAVHGALDLLLETHFPTDVLTDATALQRLGDYRLVVVPEQPLLPEAVLQALRQYISNGGCVLMSGAFLAARYAALVGVTTLGPLQAAQTFLTVEGEAVPVAGPWQPVRLSPGVRSLAYRLDEEDPGRNTRNEPVVTQRQLGQGSIVAVHGPLCRSYAQTHYPLLRQWFALLVAGLNLRWATTVAGPPRLELVLRRLGPATLIHLIDRGADETLNSRRVIVASLPPLEKVVVRLRSPRRPSNVTTVPADGQVPWTYSGGVVTLHVPPISVHRCVRVE